MIREPIQGITPRKRWTLKDCEAMEQFGILRGHYELIDGEIIDKMSTNPPHILALQLLAVWLSSIVGLPFLRTQVPILLPETGERPEPDLAVTKEEMMAYARRLPEPADLQLVVEVSDSTLTYDLTTKTVLYAQAGVPEFWVLDVTGRQLHVHRLPAPEGYREIRIYMEEERVTMLIHPETGARVTTFLPPIDAE